MDLKMGMRHVFLAPKDAMDLRVGLVVVVALDNAPQESTATSLARHLNKMDVSSVPGTHTHLLQALLASIVHLALRENFTQEPGNHQLSLV